MYQFIKKRSTPIHDLIKIDYSLSTSLSEIIPILLDSISALKITCPQIWTSLSVWHVIHIKKSQKHVDCISTDRFKTKKQKYPAASDSNWDCLHF